MNALAGTGKLIRLILRRDRWLMTAWVLWAGIVPISFVSTYRTLYPTLADRLGYAHTSGSNPVFLALYGPLPNAGLGAIVAQRLGVLPLLIGLISLLTVIRHTRTEEQTGRRELLSATVVGRHAQLAAALVVTMAANLMVTLLVGLGMSRDLPGGGSFALAAGFAAAGWVCAAIGGLAAQLTESAGTARGIAIGALGGFFLLRLVGDTGGRTGGPSWLSWLSPLGWATRLRPFADERWWVLLLFAALWAVTVASAVALSARRDIGSGMLPPRPGRAEAPPGLRSPLALAWRLHRTLLLGWVVALALIGAVLGGIAGGIGDLLKDNSSLKDVFVRMGGQHGLVDTYLAATMGLVGLTASAYGIQATLRLRAEEEKRHGEYVLATPVSRVQWVAGHLLFSTLGPAAALAAAGLSAGLAHGADSHDVGGQLPGILGGALVQLPAVWVLTGLTTALFGLRPRLAPAGWGALALFLLLGQFGRALRLNQTLLDISPFTHIPRLPGGSVSALPVVWLLAVAVLLTLAGMAGARRRDIGRG